MSKLFSEKGFKIFNMPPSEELTAYNSIFKEIYVDKKIKSGYELKSWHSGKSEMISPSFYDYDARIMNYVFSSGLIKKIEKNFGRTNNSNQCNIYKLSTAGLFFPIGIRIHSEYPSINYFIILLLTLNRSLGYRYLKTVLKQAEAA